MGVGVGHEGSLDRRLCVAPMMGWTDRHCRFLHRLLAPSALLYTEMVTTGALLFGDAGRHLAFNPEEHPVALQLGGSEPEALAACARLGEAFGYDEVNLNCGCPSDRVQRGRFGACLMAEPELVAACVAGMRAATTLPVTVKCRIGIDESPVPAFLDRFVATVADAGCTTFVIHARQAWLQGLSPKENREVPPLRHEVAHALKAAFPQLTIVLNGGLRRPEAARAAAAGLDGVMIGREACENPWSLRAFERAMVATPARLDEPDGLSRATPDESNGLSREAVVEAMAGYAERALGQGATLSAIVQPMLGLFNGRPGARAWRRASSEGAREPGAGPGLLLRSLALVDRPSMAAA